MCSWRGRRCFIKKTCTVAASTAPDHQGTGVVGGTGSYSPCERGIARNQPSHLFRSESRPRHRYESWHRSRIGRKLGRIERDNNGCKCHRCRRTPMAVGLGPCWEVSNKEEGHSDGEGAAAPAPSVSDEPGPLRRILIAVGTRVDTPERVSLIIRFRASSLLPQI